MFCEFALDAAKRLIFVTIRGRVTGAELREFRDRIEADSRFAPGYSVLIDVREAETDALTNEDVRGLAQASVMSPGARRAFVADGAQAIGLARMFATYRELKRGQEGTRIFNTLEDAEQWLAENGEWPSQTTTSGER